MLWLNVSSRRDCVSVVFLEGGFQVHLCLFCVHVIRIDDVFCQDPVTILLGLFLYLCVFGVLVCLKNDLLLIVADSCAFIQSKVFLLIVALGRIKPLSFSRVLGFLKYLRLRNAISECTNSFNGYRHLFNISLRVDLMLPRCTLHCD